MMTKCENKAIEHKSDIFFERHFYQQAHLKLIISQYQISHIDAAVSCVICLWFPWMTINVKPIEPTQTAPIRTVIFPSSF